MGTSTSRWMRTGERGPWAAVEIRLTLSDCDGEAELRYDIDHFPRRTGPQLQTIRLVTTPCRFGGVRWWWVWPASGRRVAKLYLPNGGTRFLSRGRDAYGLAYASQGEDAGDRANRRAAKLHRRLGADYSWPSEGIPPKPKGMHWRTYDRVVARLEAADGVLDMKIAWVVGRLMGRV